MSRLTAKTSTRSTVLTALKQQHEQTIDAQSVYRSDFKLGERVTHPKFGNGIVKAINSEKLTIQFSRDVVKEILDYYVKHR